MKTKIAIVILFAIFDMWFIHMALEIEKELKSKILRLPKQTFEEEMKYRLGID